MATVPTTPSALSARRARPGSAILVVSTRTVAAETCVLWGYASLRARQTRNAVTGWRVSSGRVPDAPPTPNATKARRAWPVSARLVSWICSAALAKSAFQGHAKRRAHQAPSAAAGRYVPTDDVPRVYSTPTAALDRSVPRGLVPLVRAPSSVILGMSARTVSATLRASPTRRALQAKCASLACVLRVRRTLSALLERCVCLGHAVAAIPTANARQQARYASTDGVRLAAHRASAAAADRCARAGIAWPVPTLPSARSARRAFRGHAALVRPAPSARAATSAASGSASPRVRRALRAPLARFARRACVSLVPEIRIAATARSALPDCAPLACSRRSAKATESCASRACATLAVLPILSAATDEYVSRGSAWLAVPTRTAATARRVCWAVARLARSIFSATPASVNIAKTAPVEPRARPTQDVAAARFVLRAAARPARRIRSAILAWRVSAELAPRALPAQTVPRGRSAPTGSAWPGALPTPSAPADSCAIRAPASAFRARPTANATPDRRAILLRAAAVSARSVARVCLLRGAI